MMLTFRLLFGDLPASACRQPASAGRNRDTGSPGSVLPLLREKAEKVTGRVPLVVARPSQATGHGVQHAALIRTVRCVPNGGVYARAETPQVLPFRMIQLGASRSAWSWAYICQASCSCFKLLLHWMDWAAAFALPRAGRSIAARIARIAMTTSNSMRVKAQGAVGRRFTEGNDTKRKADEGCR